MYINIYMSIYTYRRSWRKGRCSSGCARSTTLQQESVRSATIPSKPLAGMCVCVCVCACVRVHTAGGCKVWHAIPVKPLAEAYTSS